MTEPAIGITRDRAWKILTTHLKNENSIKHSRETEVIMRKLAEHFGEDPESWGITGLLHDLDLDSTADDLSRHTLKTIEILTEEGVNPYFLSVIQKHNAEPFGLKRETVFEHALACAEQITGLIVATALVYPDKKLASVKPQSIRKRMKEKSFAAKVNRDIIRECEAIDILLDNFIELSLKALQEIADELGL